MSGKINNKRIYSTKQKILSVDTQLDVFADTS